MQSLTDRKDFDRLFALGSRSKTGGISVIAASNDVGVNRVAVVATKRVGGAVARNRAKRRVRALLREIHLPESTDIAVVVAKPVLDASFNRLRAWLETSLSSAK
jgi:ribonuclease P protein component